MCEQAVVVVTAHAREAHAKDGGVRGPRKSLDLPEGREGNTRAFVAGTRERVASCERVVHALM